MSDNVKPFNSIKRSNVVDEIIESFKQGIMRGELKVGQRLPSETELVNRFNVGRGSLREAMKKLEALGVVNILRETAHISSTNLLTPC